MTLQNTAGARRRARRREGVAPIASHAILVVTTLVVLLPLLFVVFLSLKDIPGILGTPLSWPDTFHFENYAQAWTEGNLGTFLVNTVVVACITVAAILAFSSLAAFVIARYRFRGNQLLYLFFVSGLALPIQIVALPIFILIKHLHLLNTLTGLILVFASGGISYSVFILVNFMRSIPFELQEAATMDGAGPWRIYWHVVLPLIRPALGIVAIFQFLSAWKEFFLPLLLVQDTSSMTVPVGILSFVGEHSTEWQLLLAGLVIVSLPTIIGFLLVARQFRRNLVSGGVKA
ncbi:carbohydrate ABC transporter permease [Curtobacterium sp. A7_M15]|uniref:carbohydrate ABC transporter permease n=1 Tax=Curtobacterium sp. A7_M15 TaxID=3065241 RepID=UPI002737FA5A|nr:carbohydrate ABC transporter permease [Curtobacterium sp. A7_M15]MDP4331957.1 carbohydrate ABC transporter permease [Curtobacterium sp. A7_M15]